MARILLRAEDELVASLDRAAERAGCSRNTLMVRLLGDGLVAIARVRLDEKTRPAAEPERHFKPDPKPSSRH